MLKNYIKLTLRNLWKSKLFVLINIVGLGTAIGCGIVAYLNYDFANNFDKDLTERDKIYRIDITRKTQEGIQPYGFTPVPLKEALAANMDDLQLIRFNPSGGDFRWGDELFNENITYTEAGFFNLFSFDVAGNTELLNDKSHIFISDEMANKFFPDEDPVGEIITQLTDDGPRDYQIAGIFKKKPLNSSFGMVDMVTNYQSLIDLNDEGFENDWSNWVTLMVKIENTNRIASIEDYLNKSFIEIQNNARLDFKIEKYELESIVGAGNRAQEGEVYGHWFVYPPPNVAVLAPGIMAILILLIACFNFTNTSMAIASKRLKEIGLRKVMGGLRRQLIFQFMMENLLLCFMGLIVGLIIAAFLVPAYSAMWEFVELSIDFSGNAAFYVFLIIILLFTGFVAGTYPAFYVSKFEPASILKGTLKYGGTNKVTSILLTLQFTISMIAIIMGVVFYQNAIYQEELDMGFDQSGTISMYFDSVDELKAYRAELERNPDILEIAGSEHQIGRSYRNDPIKNADKEYDVDILHMGENFFETVSFNLLDGRKFKKDSETDYRESVIVSETMVKQFGWDNPIGQKLVWMDTVQLYVIGVMQDAYLQGFWNPIDPLMVRYVPEEDYHYLTAKFPIEKYTTIDDELENTWKELFPNKMYTGAFLDQQLSAAAEVNGNILKIFGFLAVAATFLSVIGLFSLISLSILKRMKEIGIRKVLGGSVSHIVFLLQKNYLIILSIACVFGSIISYFLSNALMDQIWTYHIIPGAPAFAISIVFIFIMAMFTIGFKVFGAATANPTETIRNE